MFPALDAFLKPDNCYKDWSVYELSTNPLEVPKNMIRYRGACIDPYHGSNDSADPCEDIWYVDGLISIEKYRELFQQELEDSNIMGDR